MRLRSIAISDDSIVKSAHVTWAERFGFKRTTRFKSGRPASVQPGPQQARECTASPVKACERYAAWVGKSIFFRAAREVKMAVGEDVLLLANILLRHVDNQILAGEGEVGSATSFHVFGSSLRERSNHDRQRDEKGWGKPYPVPADTRKPANLRRLRRPKRPRGRWLEDQLASFESSEPCQSDR